MTDNNCPRCGTPVDEGLNYCPKCGQKLSAREMPSNTPPPPSGLYNYPSQYNAVPDGGRGSFNVVLLVIVAVLLVVIVGLGVFFILGSGGSQEAASGSVQRDTVVQQVIVKEQVVTPAAPKPKPKYLHDGHYNLVGSIHKGGRRADVSFEFDIVGGKVSSGVYTNHKANDGAIFVNLRKSGNTISGDGYDNIGAYFKFNFTAKGNGTYVGKLYFGGTDAMNLTLYD